ncbi:hypothetical protein ACRR5F_002906 [Escherichia coli]|uniref:hypothetical protein n=1 Tax=Klebsiella pneumoniae TaxID=573 RepID=UPI002B389F07|nr:hypothetical protein [Escherichia coli]
MSTYKPGKTSEAVINKKNNITKSIIKKSELIDKITNFETIYKTLEIKRDFISEAAVHKWSDESLEIIAYTWNTSRAKHNSTALKQLQKSISNANKRLLDSKNEDHSQFNKNFVNDITFQLRKENDLLKRALAEVYRAYMYLVENFREDKVIDEAIKQLIQDQARLLGKNRVWEIK